MQRHAKLCVALVLAGLVSACAPPPEPEPIVVPVTTDEDTVMGKYK